jgi:hypothetical protein
MSVRQFVRAFAARVSDDATLRRLMQVWLTTGAVPVAHMVAEPDDMDVPALILQPVRRTPQRATGRRVHAC